jgi:hypothetical protein
MHRRNFITSCASGVVAATVLRGQTLHGQTRSSDMSAKAISTLVAARQLEVSGNFEGLRKAFHSDALRVEPSALEPIIGRAAIVDSLQKTVQERKLLYLYYRQPQALVVGNAAIVISNYEAGYDNGGKTVEETGKSSNVVLMGPNPPIIAFEMLVPNLNAGSYGALGTALTPHLGVFPLRAIDLNATKGAGSRANDVLYSEVQQINNAWVTGNANDLLKHVNKAGIFLIGDYSPFYIAGVEDVKQHFADFYKTSKVNSIRTLDPQVRIWGEVAAVYFSFDLDYNLGGKSRRSPGRAVYTFTRSNSRTASIGSGVARTVAFNPAGISDPPPPWDLTACSASHVVLNTIGDPYPTPVTPS